MVLNIITLFRLKSHSSIWFYLMIRYRTNTYTLLPLQGRSHLGERGAGGHGPPTSISKPKQGPTISVSNIRDIAFNGCSEIIWTRNFTIFTVYATVFRQYTATSNYIGEIDQFTLDFLKRSDTYSWTLWKVSIWKKTTQWMRDKMLDYRQNAGPTEKVL